MAKKYKTTPGCPANIPIYMKRGDTFLYSITMYNEDNTPFDFTGATFSMQVKDVTDGQLIIDISNDDFTITSEEGESVSNRVLINHHKDYFTDIVKGKYVYDIEMVKGNTITLQEGPAIVTDDVTNGSGGVSAT